jgi:hypothetical protein
MNDLATKELYSSPNGDHWHLCRDASGCVFVLHQPNIPSGGRTSRIELPDFLARGRRAIRFANAIASRKPGSSAPSASSIVCWPLT